MSFTMRERLALTPQTSEEQPNHHHLDQCFAGLPFPLVIFYLNVYDEKINQASAPLPISYLQI
jgi:hypothetical protein